MKVYILYWVNSSSEAEISSVWRTEAQGVAAFNAMRIIDLEDGDIDIDIEDEDQYQEGHRYYQYDLGDGWVYVYLVEEVVKGDVEEANQ